MKIFLFYQILLNVFGVILDYFRPRLHQDAPEPGCCGKAKEKNPEDNVHDFSHSTALRIDSQDQEYFRSYADATIHEEMLRDVVRTNTYRYAILKNYEHIRGRVVLDVGAGTGILSMFCVQAGAKKVYAIEASKLAEQTERVIAENHMSDRITVINRKVEDVVLPEKVDIIVSEWMGYNLLYESMLQSVLFARDTFLKKGGLMFPSIAVLYLAPFTDDYLQERLEIWNDVKKIYKVSMEFMKEYSKKCISDNVHIGCLSPENILSHAVAVCTLNLNSVHVSHLNHIQKKFEFRCFGSSKLHGFVTWFAVHFPGDIQLATSPYTEETHWGQTLFYNEDTIDVQQDTKLTGNVIIEPNKEKPRFLDISLSFNVDDGKKTEKHYFMNDCIS